MNLATAIIGGCVTALLVYFFTWFVVRSAVDGLGAPIETGAALLVVLVALAAGIESFRATRKRRRRIARR